jgi:hypothetical protein
VLRVWSRSGVGVSTVVLRDDRVLAYTRVLSLAMVPFLLAAFVVLYLLPGDTKRLFACPSSRP